MNITCRSVWERLLKPFGLPQKRCRETYQHIIHPAYKEPHRRYHTDRHIQECLAVVEAHIPFVQNIDAIVLALFFHDIVHDPMAMDNEEKSALRLYDMAPRLKMPSATVKLAMEAILATNHKPMDAVVGVTAYVRDADLAIFGMGNEEYYDANYAWPVREEYAKVPDKVYKAKRAELLQGFLDRPSIYGTKVFYDVFEKPARKHLEREIAILLRKNEEPRGTK
jgi:predicted metal-dependent HD superfamily phosphohydrolase